MKHTYEAWQISEWIERHPDLSEDDLAIAVRAKLWADYEIPEGFSPEGRAKEAAARTRDMTAFAELRARLTQG